MINGRRFRGSLNSYKSPHGLNLLQKLKNKKFLLISSNFTDEKNNLACGCKKSSAGAVC